MSVLDNSFERLKRFNLAEIFDPTPREAIESAQSSLRSTEDAEAVVVDEQPTPMTTDSA